MAALLLLVAGMSSCTVGPDFKQPDAGHDTDWTGPGPSASAGITSNLPADVRAWWRIFDDETLSSLIDRSLQSNFDIQAADSRIRQARAARIVSESGLYPTVDANVGASRSRSPAQHGTQSNAFRAGFDAAWEIDVFGGTRRAVEASQADIDAAIEDARAVRVTLAAEVATTYYDLRAAQKQLEIAHRNLELQMNTLDLTRQRQEAGFVSRLDVANAELQVANTRSRIPTLETTIRQSVYALSVLLASSPGTLLDELAAQADIPPPPPQVPIGLPSELLRRRPDIRRAEANLHAATARVGAATADLYPRFSLTGSLGLQGGEVSALGTLAQHYWSIGPTIQWPVFRAGAIRANIEQQKEIATQSLTAYQSTVLLALQEVENALVAYDREQIRREAIERAVNSSTESVDLSNQLYDAGRTDFLNVLLAQRSLLDAESSLIDSRRLVITDLIALYKALGGGWSEPHDGAVPAAPPGGSSSTTVETGSTRSP